MKELWCISCQPIHAKKIESGLEELGIETAYSTEENEKYEFHIFITKKTIQKLQKAPLAPFILAIEKNASTEIDWEEQALLHTPGYKNGLIEIELPETGKTIFLKPGPAFGDTSHPTTKLMLTLIPSYMKNEIVLDIGTGCAILAMSAIQLGAKRSFGTEIDPQALQIAKENVILNQLQASVSIGSKSEIESPQGSLTILANMISSEMHYVFTEYTDFFALPGITILSGILVQEKAALLQEFYKRGWHLLEEKTLGEWVGFVCKRS
ncbi:MAG: prmA [Chlamydiia bacterium]|nr:prmA [Chlamydiia bacterium]